MPHVLMVAYRFPPSPNVGARRSARFARHLPLYGWRISVLTIRLNGDRRRGPERTPEGLTIYRTPVLRVHGLAVEFRNRMRGVLLPRGDSSSLEENGTDGPPGDKDSRSPWRKFKDHLASLLTFPDQHAGWLPFGLPVGLDVVRGEDVNLIYSSGPPHSSHLLGLALKVMTGRPWVADFRDPWARRPWARESERDTLREKSIQWLESRVVRRADRIILNNERLREEFLSYYRPENAERFITITNGFDPTEFKLPPRPYGGSCFRITHAGTLYGRRNPRVLLEALAALVRSGKLPAEGVELQLIGKTELDGFSLDRAISELGLERVTRQVPFLPHEECLARMADSAVLLALQPETDLAVPAKIFEYLFLRRPVLALTHPGATADLVRQYGLGRVADPDRREEIESAILDLYRQFCSGANASTLDPRALTRFDFRNLTAELSRVFLSCLVDPEPSRRELDRFCQWAR